MRVPIARSHETFEAMSNLSWLGCLRGLSQGPAVPQLICVACSRLAVSCKEPHDRALV
jgi:hypothetical protein